MWSALVARYDNIALNVYVVLSVFEKLKPCAEDDFAGILNFIRKVKAAYAQLDSLNKVKEVDMVRVSRISSLLPHTLHMQWAEQFSILSDVEKYHPFSHFMEFLETHIPTIESMIDMSRYAGILNSMHFFSRKQGVRTPASAVQESPPRCILHPSSSHATQECRQFGHMNVRDRYNLTCKKSVCKKCLRPKHGACKRRCSFHECESPTTHNELLCFQKHQGKKVAFKLNGAVNDKPSICPPSQLIDVNTGAAYTLTHSVQQPTSPELMLTSKPPGQSHVSHDPGAHLTHPCHAHIGHAALTGSCGTDMIHPPTVAAALPAHEHMKAGHYAGYETKFP